MIMRLDNTVFCSNDSNVWVS